MIKNSHLVKLISPSVESKTAVWIDSLLGERVRIADMFVKNGFKKIKLYYFKNSAFIYLAFWVSGGKFLLGFISFSFGRKKEDQMEQQEQLQLIWILENENLKYIMMASKTINTKT